MDKLWLITNNSCPLKFYSSQRFDLQCGTWFFFFFTWMNNWSCVSGRSLMVLCKAEGALLSVGSSSSLILYLGNCAAAIPRIKDSQCSLVFSKPVLSQTALQTSVSIKQKQTSTNLTSLGCWVLAVFASLVGEILQIRSLLKRLLTWQQIGWCFQEHDGGLQNLFPPW